MDHLSCFVATSLLLLSIVVTGGSSEDPGTFWARRDAVFREERSQYLGSKLTLSLVEQRANAILMAAKFNEIDQCYDNMCFPPARHFFEAKSSIESSEVFKIIRKMPKGAALHGHDTGMVSTEWLVFNATYRDNLYACVRTSEIQPSPPLELDLLATVFSSGPPPRETCSDGAWMEVKELRRQTTDPKEVDNWFIYHFTLVTDNPEVKYPNINVAWEKFLNLFSVTGGMLFYQPLFRDYFVQTLQEFKDDNVQYLEIRGLLLPVYDLDGSSLNTMQVAALYQEANMEFSASQAPGDWLGSRFIYAPLRNVDNTTADEYVSTAAALVRAFPDYVAGFDLVGQEDKGKPLIDFVEQLLRLREEIPNIKYFFHAGETNWQGSTTDFNIIDALLLNTSRIGHGFALSKHPVARRMVKEQGVAIEVNPISNQVLKLVDDIRNHPAAVLLAEDFPVVVSCDDPSFWGARGLSYDFYQMFMGVASREADLKFLKQLAINSLQYSSMNEDEKDCALESWGIKWDQFIADLLRSEGIDSVAPTRQPNEKCLALWENKVQLHTNFVRSEN